MGWLARSAGVALLAALLLAAGSDRAHAHGTSLVHFGVLAGSDAWPWMSQDMINAERALGAQYARFDVVWADVQRADGTFDFSAVDERFASLRRGYRALYPLPTLHVGRGWMTCAADCKDLFTRGVCTPEADACVPGCECCQRCPGNRALSGIPEDLTAEADPAFAHSQSYYDFVQAFVARYADWLEYVVIENEVDNPEYWDTGHDPDAMKYIHLLATAYKAVKDTAANVLVTDSGTGSMLLGVCIAKDWLDSGLQSPQTTYDMLVEYSSRLPNAAEPDPIVPALGSVAEMTAYLDAFDGCAPLNTLTRWGTVDVWNFHFRESYRAIHYIKGHFQRQDQVFQRPQRPLISNGLGCRLQKDDDADEQALCLFRTLVAGTGLAIPVATWVAPDSGAGAFWDPAGAERPMADAFRLLASTLGERFLISGPPTRGPLVFRQYYREEGPTVMQTIWTWNDDVRELQQHNTAGLSFIDAVDHLGQPTDRVEVRPDSLVIDGSREPLFLRWKWQTPTSTPTFSPTATPTGTSTPTTTGTATRSPTVTSTSARTQTPTHSPTASPGLATCAGDCSRDGQVTVDELIRSVAVALGRSAAASCERADRDRNGLVTIGELVAAVKAALDGC